MLDINIENITIILVNNQPDTQFFSVQVYFNFPLFIATPCSSSGESVVSIRHLVYVTLLGDRLVCRSGRKSFPTCIPDGHLNSVTYTRCRIDTTDSPDDEHGVAINM